MDTALSEETQAEPMMTETRLLPLERARTVRLTSGKHVIEFTFRPIDEKTWRKFLEACTYRVEQRGEERVRLSDEETALIELFDRTIAEVHGYEVPEGVTGKKLAALVPMRHRLAAAQVLRATSAVTSDALTLSEFETVTLDAPWSAGSNGSMEMYTGLVHRFRQPTLEQYQRFRRGCARVVTTGDASNGVTIYPSRLAVALTLYDELIEGVEGYSYNGVDLADYTGKEAAEYMDGMHKARAVLELFDRSEEELTIGAPESAGDDGGAE